MTETRDIHDYYATDSRVIKPLLKHLGWSSGGKVIYENSCGEGHLSRPMTEAGHTVISTDPVDRGFGIGGIDFLSDTFFHTMKYDAVVMNPPYKHALEFIKRSQKLAPIVCVFLRLAFLEGGDVSGRYDFFTKNPPKAILVFSDRVPCAKQGDFKKFGKNSATAYAWFAWEEGFEGKTTLEWIRI